MPFSKKMQCETEFYFLLTKTKIPLSLEIILRGLLIFGFLLALWRYLHPDQRL